MRDIDIGSVGIDLIRKLKFVNGTLFDRQKSAAHIKKLFDGPFIIRPDSP